MEKRNEDGMVRVIARDRSGKEIFDYVKVSSLQRLTDEGYVLAVLSDIPQKKEAK